MGAVVPPVTQVVSPVVDAVIPAVTQVLSPVVDAVVPAVTQVLSPVVGAVVPPSRSCSSRSWTRGPAGVAGCLAVVDAVVPP